MFTFKHFAETIGFQMFAKIGSDPKGVANQPVLAENRGVPIFDVNLLSL